MRHRRAVLLLLLAASRAVWAGEPPGAGPGMGAVAAPDPMAATVAQDILKAGGSATDAAVAAQMMLAVVAPQRSGLGGGTVLLHYDAASHAVTGWEGREAAPAGATPDPSGITPAGGRAVGVPGTLAALEAVYRQHGKLPWADLLAPAIRAAEAGSPVSEELAAALAADADRLRRDPAARALFLQPDGSPPPPGTLLVNPALGQTLRAIASGGAAALMRGPLAADIATAIRNAPEPGLMTADDLAAYAARPLPAACQPYRGHTICTAGAPASGARVQTALAVLARSDLGPSASPALQRAAALLAGSPAAPPADALVIVDASGSAICLSSSLGARFGAGLVVRGMVLNSALADFSPADPLAPGKRPPFAPTPAFVLDPAGIPVGALAGGSPPVLVEALVAWLDWGQPPESGIIHMAGAQVVELVH